MISPISSTAPVQTAGQLVAASHPSQPQKAQSPVTDTVQLSSAKAILQEASETPSQTDHEASTGDVQARNLLAREAAARAALK